MSYFLFQTLHVAGVLGVFAALGAICLGDSEKHRKMATILHGASLLVVLLFGLHLLFSLKLTGSGGWWHVKILLWLVLGVAPALSRRKVLPPGILLGICLALGTVAAFLGLAKPF
ncbi:hypothetical protein [Haloferula sp. A504]|uniref:hypothetical protein n=1 Tax=Haloferula sp. A504 TaxID=3373601 RepID=UPI0031C1A4D8|nr:hypothetical protein [Verrucomicrobiaceae bacterium E54]